MDRRCYNLISEGLRDWEIEERLGVSQPANRAKRHARAVGLPWPLRRAYTPPNDLQLLRREVRRLSAEVVTLRSELAERRGDEMRYAASLIGELLTLIETPEKLTPSYRKRLRRNIKRLTEE